mmetsp:Transcript_10496/g.43989  ORF Transcript_10496/g.43989 Transcript_10496/m.43989 type:complete len:260 (+) Transcript_10496:222-1001(+)
MRVLLHTREVHTFTPASRRRARISATPTPSTSKVTMPHLATPTSQTFTLGIFASSSRMAEASARVRAHARSMPTSRAYCTATPSPALAQKLTSYCSNRRAPFAGAYESAASQRAPCRSSITGSHTVCPSRNAFLAYRNPIPRGPRRYLRPVPTRKSHFNSRTSVGICPTLWHASSRKGTPCFSAIAPTAAASFTKPPEVGTCVMLINLTGPTRRPSAARVGRRARLASNARTSSCPVSSSLGTTSTTTPRVRAACRYAM